MITRRSLFGLTFGGIVAGALPPANGTIEGAPVTADTFIKRTIVTVDSTLAQGADPSKATVFLDGKDVTSFGVMEAQLGEGGYIEMFARDRSGTVHHINGEFPRVRLHGHVVITFDGKADL